MRIAILSDVHGNLFSLERVLAELSRESVDEIVCLGDVAATGPQPRETLLRLRSLNLPVVMGNTDCWLLNPTPERSTSRMYATPKKQEDPLKVEEIDFWCVKQLSSTDIDYLKTFKPTLEMLLGDGMKLLCFHGSPLSNKDIITATTKEEDLARMLSPVAPLMVGGHTHTQMLRHYNDIILLNPGSVGFPHQSMSSEGYVRNPPWAEYAIVCYNDGRLSIDFRRTRIDVKAVIEAAFVSGMPHAEWWARGWTI